MTNEELLSILRDKTDAHYDYDVYDVGICRSCFCLIWVLHDEGRGPCSHCSHASSTVSGEVLTDLAATERTLRRLRQRSQHPHPHHSSRTQSDRDPDLQHGRVLDACENGDLYPAFDGIGASVHYAKAILQEFKS